MLFVDQAKISVQAGAGGNGSSAMIRQAFHRYPRPSGGDGGDGGDVLILADIQLATLLDFQFRHEFRAERGRHGGGNTRTGRCGLDCFIHVPVGTVIYDEDTGHLLRDMTQPDERLIVARGGSGGLGNARASEALPGKPGEERRLRLELKLIADVGLIGSPNAGKSSLLPRISTARPKIAAYPFTPLTPVLGVVGMGSDHPFVACDIPGLIEGAHEGRGLGMQFLRHIERTRLLVHVVDMAGMEGRDPSQDLEKVNTELSSYSGVLAQRPQLIAANKMDLSEAHTHLQRFRTTVSVPIYPISCATGAGIPELLRAIQQHLHTLEANPATPSAHE